jgi:hypothetical protein
MIQSQVVNNSNNAFYNSAQNSSVGGFGVPLKKSSVGGGSIDPMKESTINYMKAIYRTIPNLSD